MKAAEVDDILDEMNKNIRMTRPLRPLTRAAIFRRARALTV